MKKYVILSASLLLSVGAMAQKSELKSLKKLNDKKQLTEKDFPEVNKLLNATESLIANATDQEKADFYFYKGSLNLKQLMDKPFDQITLVKGSQALKDLKEAIALEEKLGKKDNTNKIQNELYPVVKGKLINYGIELNQNKEFAKSSAIFYETYLLDKKDTLNLYYAASTAVGGQDYDLALKFYEELNKLKFTGRTKYYTAKNKATGEVESFGANKSVMQAAVKSGNYISGKEEIEPSKRPEILKNLTLIYLQKDQADKAQQMLKEARQANPDDLALLLTEAEFYIKNKQVDKFEALIKEAIAKDPNNPDLYYNLGVTSAEAGKVVEAKSYYEKAIQLKPDYVNAHLNLGVLALHEEQSIIDQMNAITGVTAADNKKYDNLKKKRDDLLRSSIPYFEKALQYEPNNQFAIQNLMNIYGALDNNAKYEEFKKKLRD